MFHEYQWRKLTFIPEGCSVIGSPSHKTSSFSFCSVFCSSWLNWTNCLLLKKKVGPSCVRPSVRLAFPLSFESNLSWSSFWWRCRVYMVWCGLVRCGIVVAVFFRLFQQLCKYISVKTDRLIVIYEYPSKLLLTLSSISLYNIMFFFLAASSSVVLFFFSTKFTNQKWRKKTILLVLSHIIMAVHSHVFLSL